MHLKLIKTVVGKKTGKNHSQFSLKSVNSQKITMETFIIYKKKGDDMIHKRITINQQ